MCTHRSLYYTLWGTHSRVLAGTAGPFGQVGPVIRPCPRPTQTRQLVLFRSSCSQSGPRPRPKTMLEATADRTRPGRSTFDKIAPHRRPVPWCPGKSRSLATRPVASDVVCGRPRRLPYTTDIVKVVPRGRGGSWPTRRSDTKRADDELAHAHALVQRAAHMSQARFLEEPCGPRWWPTRGNRSQRHWLPWHLLSLAVRRAMSSCIAAGAALM